MDGNQTTSAPEVQPLAPEAGAEKHLSDRLEAKIAPVGAEASQNNPKNDDGTTAAQAQVAAVTTDDLTPVQVAAATPAPTTIAAEDVDVIEPEWVKRAEEAVAKNREDPHAEEAAFEEIQIDYLKKRYNLDVKPGDTKP